MNFNAAQRREVGEVFRHSRAIFSDLGNYDPGIACVDELTDVGGMRRLFLGTEALARIGEHDAYRFRWSVIHMRFNRIFERLPRVQEAACWELLKRSYMRLCNGTEVEGD